MHAKNIFTMLIFQNINIINLTETIKKNIFFKIKIIQKGGEKYIYQKYSVLKNKEVKKFKSQLMEYVMTEMLKEKNKYIFEKLKSESALYKIKRLTNF